MLRRTRLTLCAIAVAMPMFVTIPARAEIVEHTYTGVVTFVTANSVLSGTFSSGLPVMIAISIDRGFQGQPIGSCGMNYISVITGWNFTIGSYSRRPPGPNSLSGTIVGNDCSSPPIPNSPTPVGAAAVADYFSHYIPDPDSPNIGNAEAVDLRVNLVDTDAKAFADTQIPRVMPELSTFETATWSLSFYDPGLNRSAGRVSGTLASVATPASGSTWGRIKTAYR